MANTQTQQTPRTRGTVKWFNDSKGFGFITAENGTDAFVHFTGINGGKGHKTLHEGDAVEFELAHEAKGYKAYFVDVV